MDRKTVELSVVNLKKRLEKHYHGYTEASVRILFSSLLL
jgi:hypothetical protein